MRRRTNRRGGGGGWHWALVAACLALTALPAGARERIRGKLLDLQVKLGQGWGIMRDVPPPPAARAESSRVALLENQLLRLKRLLADAGAHRDVVEQAPDTSLIPAVAYPLAQATLYLASAPKSNSAGTALSAARQAIKDGADVIVPLHLRNEAFSAAELGHGRGYKYAHDFPGHFVKQDHLPESERERRFYRPSGTGAEVDAARRLREWWGERYRDPPADPETGDLLS